MNLLASSDRLTAAEKRFYSGPKIIFRCYGTTDIPLQAIMVLTWPKGRLGVVNKVFLYNLDTYDV